MRIINEKVRVSVPATSANLGPGFDSLGLALELRDTIEAQATATPTTVVEVSGEGAGQVPTDDTHLVARCVRYALDAVGAPQVGLHLRCHNVIPHGRGLGSSAAAIVAGLGIARGLIDRPEALDDEAIFQLATELEGHPDNAAPAVYGAATVSWMEGERGATLRFDTHPAVQVTALIPSFELATEKARGLLPAQVPHADAAFNAGRAALLGLALSAHPEHLFAATADRLHQDYRQGAMPESLELVKILRELNLPAVVSGAGPTVAVFGQLEAPLAGEIEAAGWQVRPLEIATRGLIVE